MNKRLNYALKFVLQREGGYVNDPDDLGRETNMGITKATYNGYRKSKGLSTRSVRYITNREVQDIYYNNYYKASGADKIKDPKLAIIVFDTAVNMGNYRAKVMLKQSNGNVNKYLNLRRMKYYEFATVNVKQRKFLNGWNARLDSLRSYVNNLPSDIDSDFENSKTSPKSMVLSGYIQKSVDEYGNEIKDLSRDNVDENDNRVYTREDVRNMSKEEFKVNESKIMKQVYAIGLPTKAEVIANDKKSKYVIPSHRDAADGLRWVTINGNHVLL